MEAVITGENIHGNELFNKRSKHNRDNCFYPYILLKKLLYKEGYGLHTIDRLSSKPVFELHLDVQNSVFKKTIPCYLILLETPLINPNNAKIPNFYRKVFTWNDSIVDGNKYLKINFPNKILINKIDGFDSRNIFCSMIAGNKAVAKKDQFELYSERVRAIRWFENNAPDDFSLYGVGWDRAAVRQGLLGRLINKFGRFLSLRGHKVFFSSYRGRVENKRDVLLKSRFSICYENVSDIPGYITEKIFDCFFSGCVPVYWGASNISDYIPPSCFIDRKSFPSMKSLYEYMKNINEKKYKEYQVHIADFLASDTAMLFSAEKFAETITSEIARDIKSLK